MRRTETLGLPQPRGVDFLPRSGFHGSLRGAAQVSPAPQGEIERLYRYYFKVRGALPNRFRGDIARLNRHDRNKVANASAGKGWLNR
jgi:hypothetical protein